MTKYRLAWASLCLALPSLIIITTLLLTVKFSVDTPQYDFGDYLVQSIGLFLMLIFVAPVTTLASLVAGYVAYRKSGGWTRRLVVISFILNVIAVLLVVLLVNRLGS